VGHAVVMTSPGRIFPQKYFFFFNFDIFYLGLQILVWYWSRD